VICAAVEYHGGTQQQALASIEEKIRCNTIEVLEGVKNEGWPPREAAIRLARRRIEEAQTYRRA
jgi:glutamate dehydrogenase (NAD(P)+)